MSDLAQRLGTTEPKSRAPKRRLGWVRKSTAHTILLLGSLGMALPFLWMIATSLKDQPQTFAFPPTIIPDPVVWENYRTVFSIMPFAHYMLNSFWISLVATAGTLISCSMAGFALGRLQWPGRDVIFVLVLCTLIIPAQVTMIPVFVIMNRWGWVNTYYPLTVPSFFGSAFGIFLMRQFFLTLPAELFDAAKIDGAHVIRIFAQIYLPLAKAAIATLSVFTFMGTWNDLLTPLIYLNSMDKYTVSIALTLFRGQYGETHWPTLMAASLVSILPTLILYILTQRYFVQGIATSGLKR
jgi:ABC-type glycerol-3-phosphate transport system permease component